MHGSPTASAGTLIVGAGQAGLQLAVSLRAGGYSAPITLAGAETDGPYQRPPLSKAFLAGTTDEGNLALRAPGFYTDNDIDVVAASRIVTLNPDSSGGSALTAGGRVIRFERLALTTGSRPRRLTVPGADLFGVCYLRSIDDAGRLRELLNAAHSVVVIGGGFIGLEAAAAARRRGLHVTVVESSGRLLKRVVAPPISEFYRQAHLKRGVRFRMGCGVTAVHGDDDGNVTTVELSDGTRLAADVVIVGIGVEPRIELARQLGLDCARGIIVDAQARTSNPSIVAAGDCTVQPHPRHPETLIGLESVQNAVDQAKVAAATILGVSRPPAVVPWFWSDQSDLKLQIAGLSTDYDEFVVRGDPATESFSVLYYRQSRLIAVDAVNQPHDFMAVKRALALGASIPATVAGDTRSALKVLMGAPDAAERLTVGARP